MAILYGVYDFIYPPITIDQISEHAEIKHHTAFIETIVYWFSSPFKIAGLILSAYIVINSQFKKSTRIFSIVYLCLIFISALLIGWRGPLLWIPLLLISSAYIQNKLKVLKVVLIFSLPLVFLFSFIRTYVRVNAVYMSEMSFGNRISFLINGLQLLTSGSIKLEEERGSLYESFAERAQGVRNSVFLYKLYDDNKAAGFKPVVSALFLPIPRVFWNNKMPPGSTNSTSYGMAIFLVQAARGGGDVEMGPITVAGHAYWEGGWIGILLVPFISGLFWKSLFNWATNKSMFGFLTIMIFMGSLLIDGIYSMNQPLYALIGTFWSIFLPIFLYFFFGIKLNRILKLPNR